MESRGLVRRRSSSEDRRVKVLQLTATGARLRTRLLRQMTGGSLPLSRLSLDQRRTLVEILEALVDERST
jgi:DNA-binding MarR family transcriptional regulator